MRKSLLCIDSKDRDRNDHPNSDSFRIDFPAQSEVVTVELVSTVLSNVGPVVNRHNDRLSWQNAEDSQVYYVTIPHGNYTACALAEALAEAMRATSDGARQFRVTPATITSTVLIEQFTERSMPVLMNVEADSNEVEVRVLEGHGLSSGDRITIRGAAPISNVSASRINCEHRVTRAERDRVFFELSWAASYSVSGRGAHMAIATAAPFKLILDAPNSMGPLLGFDGTDTTYDIAHTSKNCMSLAGADCCYLCSPQLGGHVTTTSGRRDVFAVLLLNSPPGSVNFNAFCSEAKRFDSPTEVSSLDIRIIDAEGRPFYLGGQDFSLTLRLTSLQ